MFAALIPFLAVGILAAMCLVVCIDKITKIIVKNVNQGKLAGAR